MVGTYVRSIGISYGVLLDAYLLDVLVHAFGMWLRYILGHVVDELMRWLLRKIYEIILLKHFQILLG
jgi:hypothetical protein